MDGYTATRRVVEALERVGMAAHGTRALLDEIRASIPPID